MSNEIRIIVQSFNSRDTSKHMSFEKLVNITLFVINTHYNAFDLGTNRLLSSFIQSSTKRLNEGKLKSANLGTTSKSCANREIVFYELLATFRGLTEIC